MAAIRPLRFLTTNTRTKHTATIIFLHGLGDSGMGWKPTADMFTEDPNLSHVKWVLPHAPTRKVTLNMGDMMPAWYDIYNIGAAAEQDEAGMLEASVWLNALITAEIDAGIPSNRIILGGFSQGGVMALLTGLTCERQLAGLITLSCYAPVPQKLPSMVSSHATSLPIFWGHGTADRVVKYEYGAASVEYLKRKLGIKEAAEDAVQKGGISFHRYPGLPHWVDKVELGHLGAWIKEILPKDDE